MPNNIDRQGHRGCRGLLPENTLAGFSKAVELGVYTLEMDVVISKDNIVVVSHEAYFNHEITTKPDGSFISNTDELNYNLYKMNYSEIKTFDVGLKSHPRFKNQEKVKSHKPSLEEVIEQSEIKSNKLIKYNIEIKSSIETEELFHPNPSVFVDLVLGVIIKNNIVNRVTIQSFDKRIIQYLHKYYSTVTCAFLYEGVVNKTLTEQITELGFIPHKYCPEYVFVTKELVLECKQHGVKIIPWTVNDIDTMKNLINMGVDGIITDYPNLFKQID